MQNVDIIIPVYKPDKKLFALLDSLLGQTVPVSHIWLANTEKQYFDRLVQGTSFQEKYGQQVSVFHVTRQEFDHGRTRHQAVERSDAPIFVMMTQDAVPADERLLEKLLRALKQEHTAVAYARQLPAEDCGVLERFARSFNYPEQSARKTLKDVERLGIKAYFCSNVCAAYRRDIYEESGGFIRHTLFNEDMIYAAKVMKQGYGVAYAAEARVYHSHNYTCGQQFHRNFDLGVSQADHPEVFAGLPSEKEGKRLVGRTTAYLLRCGRWYLIPYFYLQCVCRYAGYLLGKHYRRLPEFLIRKCTLNPQYWKEQPLQMDGSMLN